MNRVWTALVAVFLFVLSASAWAQGVPSQCGATIAGHLSMYVGNNSCLSDAGGPTSANGTPPNSTNAGTRPSGVGIVNSGQGIALYSGYSSAAYSKLLIGFDGSGNVLLTVGTVGGTAPECHWVINGETTSCVAASSTGYIVQPGDSIQAMLTAAGAAGGGTVYVLAANYTITSPLIISSGTHLVCQGATITANSVAWTDPHPDPALGAHFSHILNVNHGNFDDVNDLINDHDIEIEGCRFLTAGAFATGDTFHSINIRKATRIRIHDNSFMGGSDATAMLASDDTVVRDNSHGVVAAGNTHSSATLDGLTVDTSNIAVGYEVTGPGIPANTTVASINGATSITLSNAATATASGVQILIGASDNVCYDHWEGPKNFSVTNNTCATRFYGIMATGADTRGTTALTGHGGSISGNKIYVSGTATQAAIWVNGLTPAPSGVTNVSIYGNQVIGDGESNFQCFKVSGGTTTDVVVASNTCRNTGTDSAGGAAGGGGAADSGGIASNVTFIGNIYDGVQVQVANIAVIQLSAPNSRAIGETITGGNYPSAVWLASTGNQAINIEAAAGTGAKYNTTGATNPIICDADGQCNAIGQNLAKTTGAQDVFNVYNNATDGTKLLSLQSRGSSSGDNALISLAPICNNNGVEFNTFGILNGTSTFGGVIFGAASCQTSGVSVTDYNMASDGTDTLINAPTGHEIAFRNNNGAVASISGTGLSVGSGKTFSAEKVDTSINYTLNSSLIISATPPTIASGGCTTGSAQSISASNGSAAFAITLGGATCGSTITLTMPAAAHGWVCDAHDITTPAVNVVEQTAGGSSTSVTLTNFVRTTGVAGNFTAADVLATKCVAY